MARASLESADEEAEGDGPVRTCVVTRSQHAPEELIRFVAGPDGVIVPDLARRLPGRGVWVSLDRSAVAAAVKTRAFNRALKREVSAAADLPDLVGQLLMERARSALSIANKAGQVLAGFTKVETSIAAGTAVALLHAADGSDDGAEKLDRRFMAMCRELARPPQIVRSFTIEQISLALGRSNVVHAALTMGGAAQNFLIGAARLGKYRTGRLDVEQSTMAARAAAPEIRPSTGKA